MLTPLDCILHVIELRPYIALSLSLCGNIYKNTHTHRYNVIFSHTSTRNRWVWPWTRGLIEDDRPTAVTREGRRSQGMNSSQIQGPIPLLRFTYKTFLSRSHAWALPLSHRRDVYRHVTRNGHRCVWAGIPRRTGYEGRYRSILLLFIYIYIY